MTQTIKDKVLGALEAHKGSYVSGVRLADEFEVSRNAIWKAVHALIASGYDIDCLTRQGYRLCDKSSILSAASIEHYLHSNKVKLKFYKSIDSTNNQAKKLAEEGAPTATLVVADEQRAGRGRHGRPFISPAGTGVYFSLILRPELALDEVTLITTYSAVCIAQTIDDVVGVDTKIKWVNDLFVKGRKVCGILTEASFDAESAFLSYVIVGIGINVYAPQGALPRGAGVLCEGATDSDDVRARLVAGCINRFMGDYNKLSEKSYLDEYRRRSLLDGRTVHIEAAHESYDARVLGINDNFTLQVELEDKTQRALAYGDVHIPSSQF